jgi:hypothetical protein
VGSPGSRWLDEVNTDARSMGIRIWWRKALGREEWRGLVVEANFTAEDDDVRSLPRE